MLTIGKIQCPGPLVLAPLAGYSDLPFRLLCRQHGAGLCFSEMVSSHGLVHQQKKTLKMLASAPEERPIAFQLFGAEVKIMAKATDILNYATPDLIDINMGCPVKKVTRKGAGAALMAVPELAESIIREVVANSQVPVTVKIRKGLDAQTTSCVDLAMRAEQCGAAAVSVHGRTWAQGFTGQADWQCVADVKKAVSIPVIGNGDIDSYQRALELMQWTSCDGAMIGRGALGNPWVFHSDGRPQKNLDIAQGALMHLTLMHQHLDVERLLAVVKNHIGRYFKNLPGSSVIRKQLYQCTTFSQLVEIVNHIALSEKR